MQHGRGAEARRADRIHVTLTKDLRQALSYLARLTYHMRNLAVRKLSSKQGLKQKRSKEIRIMVGRVNPKNNPKGKRKDMVLSKQLQLYDLVQYPMKLCCDFMIMNN